jgi:hypothetical protein
MYWGRNIIPGRMLSTQGNFTVSDEKMSDESRVFLCHNTKEKPEINKIRSLLEEREIRTFMDQYNFKSFGLWKEQLKTEITSFRTAAIFLGKSGLGPWQTKEIEMFLQALEQSPENRRIGLVILPGCPDSLKDEVTKQWPDLSDRQWTDFNQSKPDPMESLILGITSHQISSEQSLEKKLTEQKKNRELRAELFQIVADGFQIRAEELFQEIAKEKARIREIEKEINQIILDFAEEIDPRMNEAARIFKGNINDFKKKAVEFALKETLEFQHQEKSKDFKIRINCLESEIEKYLVRIHTSLITRRFNILRKPMDHNSKFTSAIHIEALSHVREMVAVFQFDEDIEAEIFERIDRLNKIIAYR